MSAHHGNLLHRATRETKASALEIRYDCRLQPWLLRDKHYQNKYKKKKKVEVHITFTLGYRFLSSEKIQSALQITEVVTESLRVPGKLLSVCTSEKNIPKINSLSD